MISVAIVGKGNVGVHLYQQLVKKDQLNVIQFDSRQPHELNTFNVAILAVSDHAIPKVSKNIKCPLVVHTSGTTSIQELKNPYRKGVFYPLQSFSKEKPVDFPKVPICIEVEEQQDEKLLQFLSECLGSTAYPISSVQRNHLHVAAVFANNFTNHMYEIAKQICDRYNIPFQMLLPLIQETAQKVQYLSPSDAQTGPAKRNDLPTIKNHVHLLEESYKEIYHLLTTSIQNHGKKL